MKQIAVGYTIHDKAHLIPKIIEGLRLGFDKDDEFIFMLDGCTDNSIKLVRQECESLPNSLVLFSVTDLFETKANNKILKWFMGNSQNEAVVMFQDDIINQDSNIKQKIFTVIDEVGEDLGLMGGRSGFELESTDFPEKPVRKVSNWEHNEDQYGDRLRSNEWVHRTFLNRGPLVFTRKLIEKVGYLDEEYYPQQWDDTDYCARAKFKHGLHNVVFQCYVESKKEWGSTRRKDSNLYKLTKNRHVKTNWNKFINRWGEYLK